MRACIVGNMNLKHMTLVSLYTSFFDEKAIPYDIVYIDEYGIDEQCGAEHYYKFINRTSNKSSLLAKIGRFINRIQYKRYVKSILEKERYDLIVVWREETAIMLSGLLTNSYRKKYTVNIRDIDVCEGKRYKHNLFLLEKCVKNAAFSTVSSDGFIPYLPKNHYLFVHSANKSLVTDIQENRFKNNGQPIVISNVGTFRNDDYCFEVADFFANDSRFELRFIGQGSERMQDYVKDKHYANVFCYGAFDPSETVEYLKDADIINCAYGEDRIAEKTKMPIRFYYAVYLGKPILTTEETWIQKVADELHFGITVPANFSVSNISIDDVYEKYRAMDWNTMLYNLDNYKRTIEESHNVFYDELEQFFK